MILDRNGIPILADTDPNYRSKARKQPVQGNRSEPRDRPGLRYRRMRNRKKRQPFEFTAGTKKRAYLKYRGLCQWCGNPIKAWDTGEYHHIVSISHGGGRELSNCLPLHREYHNNPKVHAFLHGWGLEPISI